MEKKEEEEVKVLRPDGAANFDAFEFKQQYDEGKHRTQPARETEVRVPENQREVP